MLSLASNGLDTGQPSSAGQKAALGEQEQITTMPKDTMTPVDLTDCLSGEKRGR